MRYRCRAGHAYTERALDTAQHDALEDVLWTALRALKERQVLAERLVARAERSGHRLAAARFSDQAAEARRCADVIRQVLPGSGTAQRPAAEVSDQDRDPPDAL